VVSRDEQTQKDTCRNGGRSRCAVLHVVRPCDLRRQSLFRRHVFLRRSLPEFRRICHVGFVGSRLSNIWLSPVRIPMATTHLQPPGRQSFNLVVPLDNTKLNELSSIFVGPSPMPWQVSRPVQHSYLGEASAFHTTQDSPGRTGYIVIAIFLVGFVAFFGLQASSAGLHTHTQCTEKLIVTASAYSSNTSLVISMVNAGCVSSTVTSVVFDGATLPHSSIMYAGGFTRTSSGDFQLPSGQTGELSVDISGLAVTSVTQYMIDVITGAGGEYPATVLWP